MSEELGGAAGAFANELARLAELWDSPLEELLDDPDAFGLEAAQRAWTEIVGKPLAPPAQPQLGDVLAVAKQAGEDVDAAMAKARRTQEAVEELMSRRSSVRFADVVGPLELDYVPQTCPRRMHDWGPWERAEGLDRWQAGHLTPGPECSFCGSLHPDAFMALAEAGALMGPTDKNYKVYVETADKHGKFYFAHLSPEQRGRFVDLLNDGTLFMGYPGYFYNLPFFARRGE